MNKYKICKLYWKDIRDKLKPLNPEIVEIIDQISPDQKYPLYRATYPYGFKILKNGKLHIPTEFGFKAIDDPSVPQSVSKDLMYNAGTNPVSIILKNSAEIYLERDSHTIPLYGIIPPGKIFSTWRVLNPNKTHAPAFIWEMTSGARSVFMLPKISEAARHNKIKKEFKISCDKPNSLSKHWNIFKEIANSNTIEEPWNCEFLFFSKNWFKNLDSPDWITLQKYLLKTAWTNSEYLRNLFTWNSVYSVIQETLGIKPNPYVADIAKHLISMVAGEMPGFAPVDDNSAAPVR